MSTREHLQKMIRINERRLEILEQQKATMRTQTPPHILLEIEDINAELTKLRAELNPAGASPVSPPAGSPPPGGSPSPAPVSEIFVSYAWGGESEETVNQIDQAFKSRGVTIIRDKRDLGYKGQIQAFMERIGRGKAVIVVISDKYLKSPNCMFELVQIAKNGQVHDRIFPIVLPDAQIYRPMERIKYVQHWEQQIKELDEAMKTVSGANLQGFREEIDQYTDIRNTISDLVYLLKDMNTLTPEMHSQSGFEELSRAIERKLEE